MIPAILALAAATAASTVPAPAHVAAPADTCSAGICLSVTLGTDTSEGACGTATTLDVAAGDPVNFCYKVTNGSSDTLNFQWLRDDVDGAFLSAVSQTLAPGATYQYNRVFAAYHSEAPTATWTAANAQTTYAHDDTGASAFVDITSMGALIGNPNLNSWEATLTTPFPLRFYDVPSDRICVSANGFLFFDVGICPIQPYAPQGVYWFQNGPLPGELPAPIVSPYWLHYYFDGEVHYQALGTAPNRRFIVEWSNEQAWNGDGSGGTGNPVVAFEVIFDEATGKISFEYGPTAFGDPDLDNGATATVGLQRDPDYADQYSYATASLHEGQSIVWTPSSTTRYEASAQVHLNVGMPKIAVTPTALDGGAAVGASTTLPLSIANSGDRDLTWSLHQTATRPDAHFPATPRAFPHRAAHAVSAWKDPSRAHGAASPWQPSWMPGASPLAPLSDSVPAYAVAETVDGTQFVSLDLMHPDTLDTILDGEDSTLLTSTFVGNDFSKLYAIEVTRTGPTHIYHSIYGTIDTATGEFTPITTLSVGGIIYIAAIRWDPVSNQIYAIGIRSTQVDGSMRTNLLYTIDVETGTVTGIGEIHGQYLNADPLIVNLAISPTGQLYGIELADDVLVAIDKTNGNVSVIGPTGFEANYAQGMDFDQSTGALYWAGYGDVGSTMFQVDVNSGHLTSLGDVVDGDQFMALGIASPNPCRDAADVPWLSFDAQDGSTPGGQTSTVTLTLDAGGLDAGTYSADVCVYSNDANHSVAVVPVSFTVSTIDDRIFANGFDLP